MRPFDSDGLESPADHRNAMHLRLVDSRLAEDEVDPDQEAVQTELATLRSSTDQLRAENLALRSRIERLKSNRSLERRLILGGMLAVWLFFMLYVVNKLIALSN
jgi:uncharacterized coiled-coil DUF342 family protein